VLNTEDHILVKILYYQIGYSAESLTKESPAKGGRKPLYTIS